MSSGKKCERHSPSEPESALGSPIRVMLGKMGNENQFEPPAGPDEIASRVDCGSSTLVHSKVSIKHNFQGFCKLISRFDLSPLPHAWLNLYNIDLSIFFTAYHVITLLLESHEISLKITNNSLINKKSYLKVIFSLISPKIIENSPLKKNDFFH